MVADKCIYFYLNYPVQFVCTVGAVVAIDDINLEYTILTIDDGSGATLELKIERRVPKEIDPVDTSSNTKTPGLDIISRPGIFEVVVENHILNIGSVVKAKGIITEFRNAKQLNLKRIQVVMTTTEEAQAWAETAEYKLKYLSKPWHLTEEEKRKSQYKANKIRQQERDYNRRVAEHKARNAERHRKRDQRHAEREERLEVRRRKEEIMMNAGAII